MWSVTSFLLSYCVAMQNPFLGSHLYELYFMNHHMKMIKKFKKRNTQRGKLLVHVYKKKHFFYLCCLLSTENTNLKNTWKQSDWSPWVPASIDWKANQNKIFVSSLANFLSNCAINQTIRLLTPSSSQREMFFSSLFHILCNITLDQIFLYMYGIYRSVMCWKY